MPMWHIPIELRRRFGNNLPMFCDPSHIGGKRELIASISQQAMDLNFDGLIIESHCDPDCAWSDKDQQVTPDILDYILNLLVIRDITQTTESLSELRKQIDEMDDQLLEVLAKRMRISREIGTYKKEHNIQILQTARYSEILEGRINQATTFGIDGECMKKILEAIHEESVRQQMEVMK
jgi:chorismate mutase